MEIRSTSDFLAKCLANPLLKKENTKVFYRGANKIYPRETRHMPSLYYPPNKFWEHEDKIFKEVVSLFPAEMFAQRLTVEKLFILRHYKFPTRLLDISTNPLVDLFFACFADEGQEDSFNEDGVVYSYAVPTEVIKFSDSDMVAVLANLCKRPYLFSLENSKELKYLAYEIQQERAGFRVEYLEPEAINDVVCLYPSMNNPRIIRQHGAFFLFGIDGEKKNCAKMPQEWIKDTIVISAKYKKSILTELSSMGYHQGFFYPDFEHVNYMLRERYKTK